MRDLLFMAVFLPMPLICIFRPWLGLLIWTWFAYSFPTSTLWGFGSTLPGNMIITGCTLIGWLFAAQERKSPPFDLPNLLFIVLALITSISIAHSLSPELTAKKTNEYLSIFLYLMLLSLFLVSPERIHGFVAMAAFAIAQIAVHNSILFIGSGGTFRIEGPVYTQINDNNHFAAACLMVIPLLNYLRLHSREPWIRTVMLGTLVLTVIAVIGTFSRGGFIGLIGMFGFFWWKAGRKISHLLLILVGMTLVSATASESWLARMQTIETAHEEDQSFVSRLESWKVYWNAAIDRPLTGVGPKALEDSAVSWAYQPVELGFASEPRAIAAHSVYFQLAGEEGFLALGVYLVMLYVALANGRWVARRTRGRPEFVWARDLAQMAQTSVIAFAITGAALSLAYYDLLFGIVALLAALRRLVAAALSGQGVGGRR